MSAHKDRRALRPALPETPTTWKQSHVVHEVIRAQEAGFSVASGKTHIRLSTACGLFVHVDDRRACVPGRSVDCMGCIAAITDVIPLDDIRGISADVTFYDETQDIFLEDILLKEDA